MNDYFIWRDIAFPKDKLLDVLPDIETALFFASVYELNAKELGELLSAYTEEYKVLSELLAGEHSTELQGYLVNTVPDHILTHVSFTNEPIPEAEFLPQLWDSLSLEVADSLVEVADKIKGVLGTMPHREASMTFQSMMKFNKQRPSLGVFETQIHQKPVPQNLWILDVSGSMTRDTVTTLLPEVVAGSYKANASLAIVSESAQLWEPGSYSVESVAEAAEYMGTHYEQLLPLFQRDWDTVVTIADYDSSFDVLKLFNREARGRVGQVYDLSLVNRPTFLSEVVGSIADNTRHVMIARNSLTRW